MKLWLFSVLALGLAVLSGCSCVTETDVCGAVNGAIEDGLSEVLTALVGVVVDPIVAGIGGTGGT